MALIREAQKPQPLQAVQHIRKMRGGSQAHLIRASDKNLYVTKFQNNPQHVRVLVNEYLGTKVGRLLHLPMPEARIMEVSAWLIENTPELKIEIGTGSVPCAGGLQFASRYVGDPELDRVFDYLPDSMFHRIANSDDFPRVLVFDKWTGNSDGRQAAFVKQANRRTYRAVFIDQGYCFNAGEWNFPDSPLRGIFARNSVYAGVTGWKSFEPTLSHVEQMDIAELWKIASEIPEEWYEHDSEGITRLIETLDRRRSLVRELISSFRNSSRNPFPNWE
jgi:HipA-like protein